MRRGDAPSGAPRSHPLTTSTPIRTQRAARRGPARPKRRPPRGGRFRPAIGRARRRTRPHRTTGCFTVRSSTRALPDFRPPERGESAGRPSASSTSVSLAMSDNEARARPQRGPRPAVSIHRSGCLTCSAHVPASGSFPDWKGLYRTDPRGTRGSKARRRRPGRGAPVHRAVCERQAGPTRPRWRGVDLRARVAPADLCGGLRPRLLTCPSRHRTLGQGQDE